MIPQRNIAVICGGDSSEWTVSMRSAEGVMKFLDNGAYQRTKVIIRQGEWNAEVDGELYPIDKNDFSVQLPDGKRTFEFAYITIHGTPGENGLLQGYFDMLDIPYSSCGVLSSALTFNKFFCNNYLRGFGVNIAPSMVVYTSEVEVAEIIDKVGLPCFVKPNNGGSSCATTKVKEPNQLISAIKEALTEDRGVIIESFIDGVEVTCGCYKIKGKEVVFPLTEVKSKTEFFDYEAKYTASMVEEITPARIDDALTVQIQQQTLRIYDIIGAKGIIRVDYIIQNGVPFMLEVNTTPGMTVTSFIPQQIAAANLNILNVFTEIVENEF